MGRVESVFVSFFIAVLAPVCLFFAAWWLSVGVASEEWIRVSAFAGLGLGILLDFFFLRIWVARAYRMSMTPLAALYLCVSVVTYAVFMGVPLFNLLPGIVAGVYMGRRLRHSEAAGEREAASEPQARANAARSIRRTGLFTASVIACAAACSAFIALRERALGSELERMFGLKFAVTRPMIVGLVAVGGPALILAQYWCTKEAARISYGRHKDVGERPR